jgi:hypothetical protein
MPLSGANGLRAMALCFFFLLRARVALSELNGLHFLMLTDLKEAVEQRVVHVLNVTLSGRHRSFANEILPAVYRCEEHSGRYEPRHSDGNQDLHKTSSESHFNTIFVLRIEMRCDAKAI